jgi:hypothetical protein
MNRYEFEQEYMNQIPSPTLLQWLEDFCDQLNCEYPPFPFADPEEYLKRVGAWEAQRDIGRKLRYVIEAEKRLNALNHKGNINE